MRSTWSGAEIRTTSSSGIEDTFNKDAGQGWRNAADAARVTDERADREDEKHTSGGVFAAIDKLGAVIDKEEGAVKSIPSDEGSIAPARIDVTGCLRVFPVYSWHSEGWTARNEAFKLWSSRQEPRDIRGW